MRLFAAIERYTPDFQADIDVEVARIKASKPEHIWVYSLFGIV